MEGSINNYLQGLKLYGDDFTTEQIQLWFEEEAESYANMVYDESKSYEYHYHNLNWFHGFRLLKDIRFKHAMGLGSALAHEFEPYTDRIDQLTIVEPSEQLVRDKIGTLVPNYVKPQMTGQLSFENNKFDLITCFGTLHHIPNVSDVIAEMVRVLQPGGYLLIREPITSMGDWTKERKNLTKNERGIPVEVFDDIIKANELTVISRSLCYTLTSFLQKRLKHVLKKPIYASKTYLRFDKVFSKALSWNVKYHRVRFKDRVGPSCVFYLLQKPNN